mmetsp:Transcript_23438/g.50025  ORF Transcript_23438/g.50025 Transcript_23438/m.50025 type:complete len:484 (+) Transcript_23438:187-1638(+)
MDPHFHLLSRELAVVVPLSVGHEEQTLFLEVRKERCVRQHIAVGDHPLQPVFPRQVIRRPDAVPALIRVQDVAAVGEHHHGIDGLHLAHDDTGIGGEGGEDDSALLVAVQGDAVQHGLDPRPELRHGNPRVLVLELELQIQPQRERQVSQHLLQRRELILPRAHPRPKALLVELAHEDDVPVGAHRRRVRELLELFEGQLADRLGHDSERLAGAGLRGEDSSLVVGGGRALGAAVCAMAAPFLHPPLDHVVDVVVVPDDRHAVLGHLDVQLHKVCSCGSGLVECQERVLANASGERVGSRRSEVRSQAAVPDDGARLGQEVLLPEEGALYVLRGDAAAGAGLAAGGGRGGGRGGRCGAVDGHGHDLDHLHGRGGRQRGAGLGAAHPGRRGGSGSGLRMGRMGVQGLAGRVRHREAGLVVRGVSVDPKQVQSSSYRRHTSNMARDGTHCRCNLDWSCVADCLGERGRGGLRGRLVASCSLSLSL